MRDRYFDLLGKRAVDTKPEFMESPAAVITTLAASALVCATLLTLTVTKIAPAVRIATLGVEPARVEIPQASLGALPVVDGFGATIASTDQGPERLIPAALPPMAPGRDYVLAEPTPEQPQAPTHAVIAGRPPVEAVPRPAHIVALAAASRSVTDPANVVALRPTLRPFDPTPVETAVVDAAEPVIELAVVSPLAASISPRPALRPADLDVTPAPGIVARATDPTETVTLAALTPEEPAARLPIFDRNANACNRRLAREIPRRAGSAAGGQAFVASLQNVSGTSRDTAIAREVLRGNVPAFLRDLAPVSFTGVLPNGRSAQITICVTPDYLAVGSDADFVRVPLGLSAAAQIAEEFNMMLPTTRMVDAIYAQADLRLSPSPMEPGSQMSSTAYFMRHNATVEGQRQNAGGRLGMLVSGHKKDLVLTNRLSSAPGRVAIYGWHRRGGNPIQPLSTVHGAEYADYSHGIRLVSRTAFVNGQAVDLQDLLMDGTYAGLLNTDGPIGRPAIQIASR